MKILSTVFSLAFLAQLVAAGKKKDAFVESTTQPPPVLATTEAPPEPTPLPPVSFTCEGTTEQTVEPLGSKTEAMIARWVEHGQTCTRRRALRDGSQPSLLRRLQFCQWMKILYCPDGAVMMGVPTTVTMKFEYFFTPEYVSQEGGPVLDDDEKLSVQCSLTYESNCL